MARQNARRATARFRRGLALAVLVALAGCSSPQSVHTAGPGESPPTAAGSDGWQRLTASPLRQRHGAVAAWVNGTFVVVGGRDTPPCPPTADCVAPAEPALRDGAAYDPATQTWAPIKDAPGPIELASVAVVATTMYLWLHRQPARPDAEPVLVAYDAAADRWHRPSPPPNPSMGGRLAAAGRALVLFSESHELGEVRDQRYDPETDTWHALPADPLAPAYDRTIVAAGGELVLLAIRLRANPGQDPPLYEAAAYDLDTGRWRELGGSDVVGGYPQWVAAGRTIVNPSLGGADGGEVNGWGRSHPYGGMLDVRDGTWSALPDPPAQAAEPPIGQTPAAADASLMANHNGWAFTPADGTWTRLELPVHAGEAEQAAAVGDGRYYLWGGVRWSDNGRLSAAGWVWAPPAS